MVTLTRPIIKSVGEAKVRYDGKQSTAEVGPLTVRGVSNTSGSILLTAWFASPGESVIAPTSVTLRFHTFSAKRTYINDRSLKIYVDGQELLSAETKLDDAHQYPSGGISVDLSHSMPYELFLRVAEAKKVKMKLGPTGFELKEDALAALRDLPKTI